MVNEVNVMNEIYGNKKCKMSRKYYNLYSVCDAGEGNSGLIICYFLSRSPKIEFESLDLYAELNCSEDQILKWHRKYGKEFLQCFEDVAKFLDIYDGEDFGYWVLKCKYNGIDISVVGRRDDSSIVVSFAENEKVNLAGVLNDIENTCENYYFRVLTCPNCYHHFHFNEKSVTDKKYEVTCDGCGVLIHCKRVLNDLI